MLLEVEDLKTIFHTPVGVVTAVDGLSFSLATNETLGIVGESGSGKSVTALSIMKLLPEYIGETVDGSITFRGKSLLDFNEAGMRRIRGNEISMIFQEPMTSLNPVLTVGYQLMETISLHQGLPRAECFQRSVDLLTLVRIPDAVERMTQYPHQMSGGIRQRIMIAIALSCNPALLIADEPTTALDVTVQAQILNLIADLQKKTGTSVLFITHDLGVVAEIADRVMVMYTGRCVEEASVREIFSNPRHPYTYGLMTAVPHMGVSRRSRAHVRLTEIPGSVPPPGEMPVGCHFSPRCPLAVERCCAESPPLTEIAPEHKVACWEHTRIGELKE